MKAFPEKTYSYMMQASTISWFQHFNQKSQVSWTFYMTNQLHKSISKSSIQIQQFNNNIL